MKPNWISFSKVGLSDKIGRVVVVAGVSRPKTVVSLYRNQGIGQELYMLSGSWVPGSKTHSFLNVGCSLQSNRWTSIV